VAASLFTLFDDIAVLARAAAASLDDVAAGSMKAAVKSTGVVIDDAAVTPQYVQGISPKRELPIVWRITRGSLINKAIIIAAIMVLSVWAPWIFPWLLLAGGTYLAYEGAEKVLHWIQEARGTSHEPTAEEVVDRSPTDEKEIVSSAVRTDLVLSAEIMLISLATITEPSWQVRLGILIVVAIAMTALVYGTVAVLVKLDDAGMWMRRRQPRWIKILGTWLVKAMPWVFTALTIVGTLAMLWVGGHILLVNLAEVGFHPPLDLLHKVTHAIESAPGAVIWLVDSGLSAVFGLIWGAVVIAILTVVSRLRGSSPAH
jgi:predicted DNA repair protein MutK